MRTCQPLGLLGSGLTTRDGGRWGSSAAYYALTTPTYIGEHHFNRRVAKTGELLQRLYQAIDNGLADPGDRSLKSRIVELRATRDGLEGEATAR